jgi:hypothetical protein
VSSRFFTFCDSFSPSSANDSEPGIDAELGRRFKFSLRCLQPPEAGWERLVEALTLPQADAQGEPPPHLDSMQEKRMLK